MNSDCTCDYRGQNCKAYCQLLQPVGHAPEFGCYHWSHRPHTRDGDPLRELNRCYPSFAHEHGPRGTGDPTRPSRVKGVYEPSHGVTRRSRMHHSLPSNQRPANVQICNLRDEEWNSACVVRPADERVRVSRRNTGAGDHWSNHSMTFEDRDRYSAELREKYIQEMEALKAKLNMLKNGVLLDGKRLRQRSESEPGFAGAMSRQHKRARDLSPPPRRRQCCHKASNTSTNPFQRETRSVPPRMSVSRLHNPVLPPLAQVSGRREEIEKDCREDDDDMERLSDAEGSLCGEYDSAIDEINDNISEDDDYSVHSEVTSASNDSNTPSQVGRCLGSICLSEGLQDEAAAAPSLLPLPIVPSLSAGLSHTSLFRPSLFSNVPPYVQFALHDSKGPGLPVEISMLLKWKLSTITPIVIRRTLVNSGFRLVRKSNDWTGQWGKHMNSFLFKTLKDFQKLNHFPGTFQIGRKDRLWKNLNRLMLKFGKKEFGFIPTTYILPQDNKSLRIAWEKTSGKGQWIVKPPAAARGTGIRVVHRWSDIPKNKPLIVQKYISRPYLINGSKFDLRLYVLMTSVHPLRIYLYDDGLVRFASVKYSENVESLSDRFMHLTNYSINKLSNQYCANEDASSCQGHKWTLKTLWVYLEKQGVNVKVLQKSMTDLVIKTIISGESHIQALSKSNLPSRYCSYELFGIDVLLDAALRPWLLEVNISPSLHSSSPLDLAVKGPLVRELLNLAGFQVPAKLTPQQENEYLSACGLSERTSSLCYDKRLYTTALSREERIKHASHNLLSRKEYLACILESLTPDDVRHLIQFEDELTQLKRFEKVFPTTQTHMYHQYFDSPRYYNMMLDAWETKYHRNREEGIRVLETHCLHNLHLQVPFPGGKAKSCASRSDPSAPQEERPEEGDEDQEAEAESRDLTRTASRSGKRRKTGLLAKPHLRATVAPRRTRVRTTPEPQEPLMPFLPRPCPPPWPSILQTCKLESSAVPSAPQLPAINIRTSS